MTNFARAVRPSRFLILGLFGLCAIVMAGVPARAGARDAAVQAFIQTNVDHGIAVLKDKSLSPAAQREQVREILSNLLDTKKIGLFALGKDRAEASQADLDAYVAAFNRFMIESYVTRLDGYGGQSLKVTGVIDHAPGDYVVTAVLVDPAAPTDPDPLQVAFRVLDEGGKFAVVDASIAGVWLGLAQRDDFVGYLGQHGDSVPQLTAHLKQMTASFTAPPASAPTQSQTQ